MNISFVDVTNSCSVAIIDDFYNSLELATIKKELVSLYEVSKLGIYSNHKLGLDENNQEKQKSKSLFLDELFIKNRTLSKILSLNRKLFTDVKLKQVLLDKNIFYSLLYDSNKDSTLLNFYEKDGLYKTHKDATCFTALTFFELEPFVGGNLMFPEYNVIVESLENRTVIFPGFLPHAADEVKSGIRVSMAQFVNMV